MSGFILDDLVEEDEPDDVASSSSYDSDMYDSDMDAQPASPTPALPTSPASEEKMAALLKEMQVRRRSPIDCVQSLRWYCVLV